MDSHTYRSLVSCHTCLIDSHAAGVLSWICSQRTAACEPISQSTAVASCKMVDTMKRGKQQVGSAMDPTNVSKRSHQRPAQITSTTELPAGYAPKQVQSNEPQHPPASRKTQWRRQEAVGEGACVFPHIHIDIDVSPAVGLNTIVLRTSTLNPKMH